MSTVRLYEGGGVMRPGSADRAIPKAGGPAPERGERSSLIRGSLRSHSSDTKTRVRYSVQATMGLFSKSKRNSTR